MLTVNATLSGTMSAKTLKRFLIFFNLLIRLVNIILLERRRFNRIFVSLPVEYQARLPDTKGPYKGQGFLRDISLSGIYFHFDSNIVFKQGQVLSLSIFAPLQYLEGSDISHLWATGEVIRFDPPASNQPLGGVALSFLEGPTFLSKDNQEMFQSLNQPRPIPLQN